MYNLSFATNAGSLGRGWSFACVRTLQALPMGPGRAKKTAQVESNISSSKSESSTTKAGSKKNIELTAESAEDATSISMKIPG